MMKIRNKLLAGALALLMLVSLVPISALALTADDVVFEAGDPVIVNGTDAVTATVSFKANTALTMRRLGVTFSKLTVESSGIAIAETNAVATGSRFTSNSVQKGYLNNAAALDDPSDLGSGYIDILFNDVSDVAAGDAFATVTYVIPGDTAPGTYTVTAKVYNFTASESGGDVSLGAETYTATITVIEPPVYTMQLFVESPARNKPLGDPVEYDLGEAVQIHGPETYGGGNFQYWVIKDSNNVEVARYTVLEFTYYPTKEGNYTATAVYTAEAAATTDSYLRISSVEAITENGSKKIVATLEFGVPDSLELTDYDTTDEVFPFVGFRYTTSGTTVQRYPSRWTGRPLDTEKRSNDAEEGWHTGSYTVKFIVGDSTTLYLLSFMDYYLDYGGDNEEEIVHYAGRGDSIVISGDDEYSYGKLGNSAWKRNSAYSTFETMIGQAFIWSDLQEG